MHARRIHHAVYSYSLRCSYYDRRSARPATQQRVRLGNRDKTRATRAWRRWIESAWRRLRARAGAEAAWALGRNSGYVYRPKKSGELDRLAAIEKVRTLFKPNQFIHTATAAYAAARFKNHILARQNDDRRYPAQ